MKKKKKRKKRSLLCGVLPSPRHTHEVPGALYFEKKRSTNMEGQRQKVKSQKVNQAAPASVSANSTAGTQFGMLPVFGMS